MCVCVCVHIWIAWAYLSFVYAARPVLQCVAMCCSVLQCVAVSVLEELACHDTTDSFHPRIFIWFIISGERVLCQAIHVYTFYTYICIYIYM